ncbi:MAG: efflux RND transporter permease subunit [Haliea sp.]|nr:efflux RND transporter permease subunit [Haliea sp.]
MLVLDCSLTVSHAKEPEILKPQIHVDIDRDKAGELGIDMEDIATTSR